MKSLKLLVLDEALQGEFDSGQWHVDEVSLTKSNSLKMRLSSPKESMTLFIDSPVSSHPDAHLEGATVKLILLSDVSTAWGHPSFIADSLILDCDGSKVRLEAGR